MKSFIKALAERVLAGAARRAAKMAARAARAAKAEMAETASTALNATTATTAENEEKAEREAFSMLIGYNALVAYGVKQLGQEGGAK